MRQALRAGQGLREDWKALKRRGKDIREDGEGGETPSVSGVLWREQGWDGADGGWKNHDLWNHGKEWGSGTPGSP